MKLTNKLFFLVFLVPFFCSCSNFDKILIGEPQEVKVQGFDGNLLKISALVPVNNPTIHKINIDEIDVKVFLNQQYLGKLIIDEQIVINAKEEKLYNIPVKIRLANILNAAFIMLNLKSGQQVEFRFEGVVKVHSLFIKRSIPINQANRVVM